MNASAPFSERASHNTHDLLRFVGIEYQEGRHIDCPLCDGKKKARIRMNGVQIPGGAWVCPSCTANQYKPLLDLCLRVDGREFAEFASDVEGRGIVSKSDQLPKPCVERAQFQYKKSSIRESRYLESRGLYVPEGMDFGHHATYGPVMVGTVRNKRTVIGRHFTLLEGGVKTGRRYQKRYEDSPTTGYIALMPHGGTLGVAEGVETALAASIMHDVPCWSCIDARQLSRFDVPGDVKALRIFGDFDDSGTGQAAAWELYRRTKAASKDRLLSVGRPEFPERGDWNDALRNGDG